MSAIAKKWNTVLQTRIIQTGKKNESIKKTCTELLDDCKKNGLYNIIRDFCTILGGWRVYNTWFEFIRLAEVRGETSAACKIYQLFDKQNTQFKKELLSAGIKVSPIISYILFNLNVGNLGEIVSYYDPKYIITYKNTLYGGKEENLLETLKNGLVEKLSNQKANKQEIFENYFHCKQFLVRYLQIQANKKCNNEYTFTGEKDKKFFSKKETEFNPKSLEKQTKLAKIFELCNMKSKSWILDDLKKLKLFLDRLIYINGMDLDECITLLGYERVSSLIPHIFSELMSFYGRLLALFLANQCGILNYIQKIKTQDKPTLLAEMKRLIEKFSKDDDMFIEFGKYGMLSALYSHDEINKILSSVKFKTLFDEILTSKEMKDINDIDFEKKEEVKKEEVEEQTEDLELLKIYQLDASENSAMFISALANKKVEQLQTFKQKLAENNILERFVGICKQILQNEEISYYLDEFPIKIFE